jgi:hypothetical protein
MVYKFATGDKPFFSYMMKIINRFSFIRYFKNGKRVYVPLQIDKHYFLCVLCRMHIEIYPRRENHRSYSITAVTAPLYLACQNNDLTDVESCMKKTTINIHRTTKLLYR